MSEREPPELSYQVGEGPPVVPRDLPIPGAETGTHRSRYADSLPRRTDAGPPSSAAEPGNLGGREGTAGRPLSTLAGPGLRSPSGDREEVAAWRRPALRFLVGGALNSLVTFLLYVLLLRLVSYRLAYTLAYAAGIVLAFVVNSVFVFEVGLQWRRITRYPLVHAAQYVVGYAGLTVMVDGLRMDPRLGAVAVVALTVPVGFVASRWIFHSRA